MSKINCTICNITRHQFPSLTRGSSTPAATAGSIAGGGGTGIPEWQRPTSETDKVTVSNEPD